MRWIVRLGVPALLVLLAYACSGSGDPEPEAVSPAPASARAAAAPAPAGSAPRIVFLGDSLTAGYGLGEDQAYPSLVQARLRQAGYDYDVINAGVSGDTSAGGLRRLDWSLRGNVAVLVIALGGNDGLRGLPPSALKKNLQAMIDEARSRDIDVVLAGMEAPPNFGPTYTTEFRAAYRDLATQPGVTFLPFLLEGVAGDRSLNQSDGIHPNVAGQQRVADTVWATLRPLIDRRRGDS
jgi:acyl-CoA thioesterase I